MPPAVSTPVLRDAARVESRRTTSVSCCSSLIRVTRIATLRASWSAAAIARSCAIVRTSRHSGTTNDTTTTEVVAMTSQKMRRRTTAALLAAVRVDEAYPDPAHAVQVARLGGGLAELASQPRQVHVDGPVRPAVRVAPDLGEELALRDDLAGPRRQREQQVELLARQLQRLAGEARGPGALVDDELAHPDRLGEDHRGRPVRRSTARIRAASWSVPNGFTT